MSPDERVRMFADLHMAHVLDAAAMRWGVKPRDVFSRVREQSRTEARWDVWAHLCYFYKKSTTEAGRLTGHDPSTVGAALKKRPTYRFRRDWAVAA